MLIITDLEIEERCKELYWEDWEIVTKHGCDGGEKEFAMCMIETILALLDKEKINDEFIIQYLKGLISLSKYNSDEYKLCLEIKGFDEESKENALKGQRLSKYERRLLSEMMKSNLAEYMMKGNYQNCCYSAMKVFMLTTYCILCNNINSYIEAIDMIIDLDDELERINVYFSDSETNNIYVNWVSKNKINDIYMLYKTQYLGLDNDSILELVSADVIEEEYYYKDERFTIAPSILVKQYCSIVEHEVNEIIQLMDLPDKPKKHLMWRNMKEYVKDHNINLESVSFELSDMLEEWCGLRNKSSHGEIITKKQYKTISKYKNQGVFDGISQKKIDLKGIQVTPSIEDIGKYMGFDN